VKIRRCQKQSHPDNESSAVTSADADQEIRFTVAPARP
jgi:hypothetical protein